MRTRRRAGARAQLCPADINVLIACEESQAECKAFRLLGFNAFSCDIQTCRKKEGHPEWHILGDVTPFLRGSTSFVTQSGDRYQVKRWHLIIAHPPCTYLCKVSAVRMKVGGVINPDRFCKMIEARKFFFECLNAKADYVAVENPLPMRRAGLPKPSCFIQPYWFGVPFSKKTLYWLDGLPPLLPTVTSPTFRCYVKSTRGKYRSRTFALVASAIAEQWGNFIVEDMNKAIR